jgi:hypothetical protein
MLISIAVRNIASITEAVMTRRPFLAISGTGAVLGRVAGTLAAVADGADGALAAVADGVLTESGGFT